MTNLQQTKYWPHIDGLRAFAVLAVLFFHFKTPGFSDGYLGVDVFFVISGFLVSRIILKDIEEFEKVRFGRFFARRVRRLFPTLAAVCVVTAIIAYFLLDNERLTAFGKSVGAAIVSLSNINFWSESGYFDTASDTKPLLHTWSLSVEEQFYLIWPATLALGYKIFKDRALKILSITGFLLSVALILIWTLGKFDARADSTVFFWMPFRVFEFMMGAMALLVYDKVLRADQDSKLPLQTILCVVGLLLMLAAIILPGFVKMPSGPVLGFIACLGATLVILAPGSIVSTKLLSNKPVRWIGQISYSLYLVHWPLWVFLPDSFRHQNGMWVVLIALSVLLTIPLHYMIENPLRRASFNRFLGGGKNVDLRVFAVSAAVVVIGGWYISSANNLPMRAKTLLTAEQVKAGYQDRFQIKSCHLNNIANENRCDFSRPKQILFFGNSHEPDALNAFEEIYGEDESVNLISYGTANKCEMKIVDGIFLSSVTALKCDIRAKNLNKVLTDRTITHVVYLANYPYAANKEMFWEALALMQSKTPSLEIIVMGGFLNTTESCSVIANRDGSYGACFDPEYVKGFPIDERNSDIAPKDLSYLYIDRIGLMCKDKKVANCIDSGFGEPAFYDSHHLSYGYSRLIGQKIKSEYAKDLAAIGLPVE